MSAQADRAALAAEGEALLHEPITDDTLRRYEANQAAWQALLLREEAERSAADSDAGGAETVRACDVAGCEGPTGACCAVCWFAAAAAGHLGCLYGAATIGRCGRPVEPGTIRCADHPTRPDR
jgi:hypothetical protein